MNDSSDTAGWESSQAERTERAIDPVPVAEPPVRPTQREVPALPGPGDRATPDGTGRATPSWSRLASRRAADSAPLGHTLRMTVVAALAFASYAATRLIVGVNDPLGVGLAAVPLFLGAAFLRRPAALALGAATVALTVVPTIADSQPVDLIDLAIAVELAIVVLAAMALRAALIRAAASATREAAHEARTSARLDTVLAITGRLATTLDRDVVLQTIVEEVNRGLGADATTIRLLEDGQLVVKAWAGIPGEVARSLPAFRPDEGWFAEVFRTGRPWVCDDVGAPGTAEEYERYRSTLEFASDIALPLVVDGRVIGALSSVTRERRHWTPGDVEFAATVATHASIAIRNAELFATSESWAARLGVLQAASARMSRQNTIESVGRAIVEEVRRIIDYHNCRVYILEPPDELVAIAFEGTVGAYEKVDFELLRTKVGEGFTGWAAQHGEALLIDEANADPRGATIPGTDDVDESMLVVPMRYDENVVGVITLSKLGLRQFDAGDLRLLAILADQAATALESARLLGRTERLTRELRWLLDMGSDLTRSLDPRQVADLIARHVGSALGADACTVSAWDPRAEQLLTLGYWPETGRAGLQPVFDLRGYPLTRRVLREQVSVTVDVDDPAADAAEVALLRSQDFNSLAMLPLVAKGESVGLVEIYTSASIEFDAPRLELARTMASEAAMALENARLYEATRKLADHDQLTGFYNHRSVHERLGEELIRARRSRAPLAVLMIDLDGFKLVNDTFGHLFGDQVLAWTATQIRSSLRASDVAGRYGGDEFAIILPEADRAAADATARRIRNAITEHPFESEERGPIPVGASIGVATYPVDGRTAPELLALADAAMYRVKREGDLPAPMGRPVPRRRHSRAVPAGADRDLRTTG